MIGMGMMGMPGQRPGQAVSTAAGPPQRAAQAPMYHTQQGPPFLNGSTSGSRPGPAMAPGIERDPKRARVMGGAAAAGPTSQRAAPGAGSFALPAPRPGQAPMAAASRALPGGDENEIQIEDDVGGCGGGAWGVGRAGGGGGGAAQGAAVQDDNEIDLGV